MCSCQQQVWFYRHYVTFTITLTRHDMPVILQYTSTCVFGFENRSENQLVLDMKIFQLKTTTKSVIEWKDFFSVYRAQRLLIMLINETRKIFSSFN